MFLLYSWAVRWTKFEAMPEASQFPGNINVLDPLEVWSQKLPNEVPHLAPFYHTELFSFELR